MGGIEGGWVGGCGEGYVGRGVAKRAKVHDSINW